MALPELQQALSLLKRSTSTLLIVPEKPSPDAFASMVALYITLIEQSDKQVDAVSPSHVPGNLQFLPGSSQVVMRPRQRPEVVLDIAGPEEIADVRQERLQGGVRLHIALPDGSVMTKDQLETSVRALPYDVAIVFGASDLEALGNVFTAHTDFFYNTPIINVDHRADNEYFGTVNMVDITASSVAEVVYDLLLEWRGGAGVDAEMATNLYAGIVSATESFQLPSTSPRSFEIASQLMKAKADKEAVIQHIVKTKPLNLLKLLGRTYARLRSDTHIGMYWSVLRPLDFTESGATPDDIPAVMHELINSVAGFSLAWLLHEAKPDYELYIVLGKGLRSRRKEIQEQLGAHTQNGALHLQLPAASLQAAEEQALERLRTIAPPGNS